MNCRALMELIAINVGAALGVIPQSVYSMLVIMALFTTIMTTPLLFWFKKGTEIEDKIGFTDSTPSSVSIPIQEEELVA